MSISRTIKLSFGNYDCHMLRNGHNTHINPKLIDCVNAVAVQAPPQTPQLRGGAHPKGAPPWGILRKKGERTKGDARRSPAEGRFRGIVKEKERKCNSEMIIRMQNDQLSYWQSHGALIQIQMSEYGTSI